MVWGYFFVGKISKFYVDIGKGIVVQWTMHYCGVVCNF